MLYIKAPSELFLDTELLLLGFWSHCLWMCNWGFLKTQKKVAGTYKGTEIYKQG